MAQFWPKLAAIYEAPFSRREHKKEGGSGGSPPGGGPGAEPPVNGGAHLDQKLRFLCKNIHFCAAILVCPSISFAPQAHLKSASLMVSQEAPTSNQGGSINGI